MRGEYRGLEMLEKTPMELPPRARRIPVFALSATVPSGTTSACAENTSLNSSLTSIKGNYLRVRGEYGAPGHMMDMDEELPPRARRILNKAEDKLAKVRNYLRVRGEYCGVCHGLV